MARRNVFVYKSNDAKAAYLASEESRQKDVKTTVLNRSNFHAHEQALWNATIREAVILGYRQIYIIQPDVLDHRITAELKAYGYEVH